MLGLGRRQVFRPLRVPPRMSHLFPPNNKESKFRVNFQLLESPPSNLMRFIKAFGTALKNTGVKFEHEKMVKILSPELAEKACPGTGDVLRKYSLRSGIDFDGVISVFMEGEECIPTYSILKNCLYNSDFKNFTPQYEKNKPPEELVQTLEKLFRSTQNSTLSEIKNLSYELFGLETLTAHFFDKADLYLMDTILSFKEDSPGYCLGCERLSHIGKKEIWDLINSERGEDFQICKKDSKKSCAACRILYITWCLAPLSNKLEELKTWSQVHYELHVRRIGMLIFLGVFEDYISLNSNISQRHRNCYQKDLEKLAVNGNLNVPPRVQVVARILYEFIKSYNNREFSEVRKLCELSYYDLGLNKFVKSLSQMIEKLKKSSQPLSLYFPKKRRPRRSREQIYFEILDALNKEGESTLTKIAKILGTTGPRLKGYLDLLLKKHYIEHHIKERVNFYRITKEGEKLLENLRPLYHENKYFTVQ